MERVSATPRPVPGRSPAEGSRRGRAHGPSVPPVRGRRRASRGCSSSSPARPTSVGRHRRRIWCSTGTRRSRASTRGSSAWSDDWTVVDDGLSRNGTFVNGERLTGRRRLSDGDTVRFGATTMTFRSPQPEEHAAPGRRGHRPPSELSTTQRRVLVALCRPYKDGTAFASPATNQQIAEELFLSVDAVRTHLRVLFAKSASSSCPEPAADPLVERAFSTGLSPSATSKVLSPGSTIAGYEVEGVVGAGGIGILYRARQVRLDRPVALKVVEREVAATPSCGSACAARPGRWQRSTTPTSSRCTRLARRTAPSSSSRAGWMAPSSVPDPPRRPAGAGAGGRHHGADRVGARGRPREGARAQRREALQRAGHVRGSRLPHRFRPDQACRARRPASRGPSRCWGRSTTWRRSRSRAATRWPAAMSTASPACSTRLLVGAAPFAGEGGGMAKMWAHLNAEPPSVREQRPDVPAGAGRSDPARPGQAAGRPALRGGVRGRRAEGRGRGALSLQSSAVESSMMRPSAAQAAP